MIVVVPEESESDSEEKEDAVLRRVREIFPGISPQLVDTLRAAAVAALASALGLASLSFGIWQNWWLATLVLAAAITTALLGKDEKPDQAEPPPN